MLQNSWIHLLDEQKTWTSCQISDGHLKTEKPDWLWSSWRRFGTNDQISVFGNKNLTGGSCCCIKSHLTKFSCFNLHVNTWMFSGSCFPSSPSQWCHLCPLLVFLLHPFAATHDVKGLLVLIWGPLCCCPFISLFSPTLWRCCWWVNEVSSVMTQSGSFIWNNRLTCGEKVNEWIGRTFGLARPLPDPSVGWGQHCVTRKQLITQKYPSCLWATEST